MGCDIHAYAEVREDGKWRKTGDVFPFDDFDREWHRKNHGDKFYPVRNYGVFGFLAGVRNYSDVTPIAQPRGIPGDVSLKIRAEYEDWEADAHTPSWLSARELAEFNYDAPMVDRRITRQTSPNSFDGGCTATAAEEALTTKTTYREFLGDLFLTHVEVLKELGPLDDVRIVFWFDN